MNCKHKNLLKGRITTGKCITSDWHSCMEFCIQPKGLQEYICKDCGKEIYKEVDTIDCQSEEGQTIGLIDSLIHISREIAKKDLTHLEIKEAFKDLASDSAFQFIVAHSQLVVEEL